MKISSKRHAGPPFTRTFSNRFLNQPDEQFGGVRETIGNYLQYFLTPEVAEVFCTGESTFDFAAIDQGKIILTTMPQKFQTERRYVNTFLKLLYYNHALRRFDKAKADRAKNNLLILWADEAQRFMTASEDGTSDYNCVDVIREAGATDCRRRAKHDFACAATGQRQIESADA